ncbi:unnamed protein product, partial [Adineta steineri]
MVAVTRAALTRQLQSTNTTRAVVSRVIRKKSTKQKKRIVKQRATTTSIISTPLQPYNDVAGKSNITNAIGYDRFGNATGREYDLGRDGAFMGFNILIAQFYWDSQFNDTAIQVPIDELKKKGFQVKHIKTEDECITELASNRYQITWIISGINQIQNPKFISSLIAFHSGGGAIFLFADNTPGVYHASEFLKTKFGITVDGNYYGGQTMTYKEDGHRGKGNFGQHEIFTGIT